MDLIFLLKGNLSLDLGGGAPKFVTVKSRIFYSYALLLDTLLGFLVNIHQKINLKKCHKISAQNG